MKIVWVCLNYNLIYQKLKYKLGLITVIRHTHRRESSSTNKQLIQLVLLFTHTLYL